MLPLLKSGALNRRDNGYSRKHVCIVARASRRTATRIEFDIETPVDVVVDGEVLTLEVESLEVLPSALDVAV